MRWFKDRTAKKHYGNGLVIDMFMSHSENLRYKMEGKFYYFERGKYARVHFTPFAMTRTQESRSTNIYERTVSIVKLHKSILHLISILELDNNIYENVEFFVGTTNFEMAKYLNLVIKATIADSHNDLCNLSSEEIVMEVYISKKELLNSKIFIQEQLERSKSVLIKMRIKKLRKIMKPFLKFLPTP